MQYKQGDIIRVSGNFHYNSQTAEFTHYLEEEDCFESALYIAPHPYLKNHHFVRIWAVYVGGGECNFDRHDQRQWPEYGGHRRHGLPLHEKHILGFWDESEHGLTPENDPNVTKSKY